MAGNAKEKICDALCALAGDRPVAEIPVSALVEKSGVNRSTFYYHFSRTEDVAAYMLGDYLDKLLDLVFPAGDRGEPDPDAALEQEKRLCEYVLRHKARLLFFLSERNYCAFKQQFLARSRALCTERYEYRQTAPDGTVCRLKHGIELDYLVNALCYQSLGLFEYWAERQFSESPEDFLSIFRCLAVKNVDWQPR